MTSMRRTKLRGIQSADAMYTSHASGGPNANTRLCSRKRSTTLMTRMRSDSPLTPAPQAADAAHEQIDVDARLARRVERADRRRVDERVHLGDDARRLALARPLRLLADEPDDLRLQIERRHRQPLPVRRLAVAGEHVEERRGVLGDLAAASSRTTGPCTAAPSAGGSCRCRCARSGGSTSPSRRTTSDTLQWVL